MTTKPYDGPRDPRADYFDDFMNDTSTPALFDFQWAGKSGAQDYQKVEVKPTQNAVLVKRHCPKCNLDANIELGWGELFVVANAPRTSYLPEGWARSDKNQAPYPVTYCRCEALCTVMVPPDWAMKQVDAALRAGLIDQGTLQRDEAVQRMQQFVASKQPRRHGA